MLYSFNSFALLAFAGNVAGWGGLGHRTVGYLAEHYFTEDAAQLVLLIPADMERIQMTQLHGIAPPASLSYRASSVYQSPTLMTTEYTSPSADSQFGLNISHCKARTRQPLYSVNAITALPALLSAPSTVSPDSMHARS